MDHKSIRIARRSREIVVGAIVALACSACASPEKTNSVPTGAMMPPPMSASYDPANQMASFPSAYSRTAGMTAPMASAGSPVVNR